MAFRLLTLVFILVPATGVCAPCYKIKDDAQRLACYDRMTACLGERDDSARLSCLDTTLRNRPAQGETATGRAAPGTREATVASPVEQDRVMPQAPSNEDQFGKPPKQPDHLTSTIVKISHGYNGVDYITLENKQVWRETIDQTNRFKVGQVVTIKPGIFGSFSLYCDDLQRLVKVHRVK